MNDQLATTSTSQPPTSHPFVRPLITPPSKTHGKQQVRQPNDIALHSRARQGRGWSTAAAGTAHALLLTGYLGASWGSGWLPWQHPVRPGWTDGPQAKALLLAAVLLLAGLAEWAVARRRAAPGATDAGTVAP